MSVEQNLWSLRLANGAVRSGTIEQLEEAFQAGHIDGNSYVLPPGAREWVKLDSIAGRGRPPSLRPPPVVAVASSNGLGVPRPSASPPPAASQPPPARTPANDDIWQVRLPNGEIRSGTRRQLEEAFQAGHIDGSSLALPGGAREWMRLETVLRRTEVAAASASVSPQYAVPTPTVQDVPASPPQVAPQPPATESDDDVCQVKVTRRLLADAFRAGYLDEGIPVLTFGATEWVRLGSLVDRGPVVPPPPPSIPASVVQTGAWPPADAAVAEEAPLSTPQSEPVTLVTTEQPLAEPTGDDNVAPTSEQPLAASTEDDNVVPPSEQPLAASTEDDNSVPTNPADDETPSEMRGLT